MIRQAVGAIAKTKNGDILLVEKVKWHDKNGNKINTTAEWDIPKGGVKSEDKSLQEALVRELTEETGSAEWEIVSQYDAKIQFTFPTSVQEKIGYKGQHTTLFHVVYTGNNDVFTPIDTEIKSCRWVSKENIVDIVAHEETKHFLTKYVL